MVGLVTVAKIMNGAGAVVGKTESVYDEAGRSPGQRGFVTTSKAWDKLGIDNSSFISTQAKFDVHGNQTEATDEVYDLYGLRNNPQCLSHLGNFADTRSRRNLWLDDGVCHDDRI